MNAQPEEVDLELEEALKDAPPKVDFLFDPRPMPPLNVFLEFRRGVRSSCSKIYLFICDNEV